MQKLRAFLLVVPLLLFVLLSFVGPIIDMLFRSVENYLVSDTLPRTVAILDDEDVNEDWQPSEDLFSALYVDLAIAVDVKAHTRVGSRLNYERSGIASLFRSTGRKLSGIGSRDYAKTVKSLNPSWEGIEHWQQFVAALENANALPNTTAAFRQWQRDHAARRTDVNSLEPQDVLFVVLVEEALSVGEGRLAAIGSPHSDNLAEILANAAAFEPIEYKEAFLGFDKKWADRELWVTVSLYSSRLTSGYFLNSIDLKKSEDGIEARPERERLYTKIFMRTFAMSIFITLCCLVIGYPVAYLMANLPTKHANILLILVLLPFWTSLLVRTAAWKVLLQEQGVINDILVSIGLIGDLNRLAMINNQLGTIIAMTHILLPFMILPLFSVMRTIPPSFVIAARSLGATPVTAFRRVYFPQSLAGVGAGMVLVFILAIGYYITPELVGGTNGTFISNRIAYHISSSLNWGLGAALATILLAVVIMLYWTYDRLVGIDNVKLG
ncbi:MAG: ABC transporter permease [Rhodobacteraceae bacterium]|nr:ABC transporter permease [Paracoccaceae bacterium]